MKLPGTPTAIEFIKAVARKFTSKRGEGIASIGNRMEAEAKAGEIAAIFQDSGLSMDKFDNFIKSENDVLKYLNIIEEGKRKQLAKSGDVIEFPQKRSFGEEVDSMIKKGEVNIGTADKTPPYKPSKSQTDFEIQERYRAENAKAIKRFEEKMKNQPLDPDVALPNYKETPGEYSRRKTPGSIENLREEIKIAYRKEFDRLKGDETAEELTNILKNLDTDGVPFATGGRAGLYQGGQAEIKPDLSDIGHGSDALMARNMLISPGSQATTSTGLNYLLGEDNDTTRVPYEHGNTVLPKPKPKEEYLLKQVLSQAGANTLDPRTRQMFIEELKKKIRDKNSKAEGGPIRTPFKMGKRAFLQWLGSGAAGIAGLKSGLFGWGKKAAVKSTLPAAVKSVEGVPPYFFKLVAKIKALGDDVTATAGTLDRQTVKKYKDYEMTTDTTTGKIEIQRYKVDPDSADYYGQPLTEETYMSYKPGEEIFQETAKGKTKIIKTKPEYEEGTAYIRSDREFAGEVVDESFKISDDILREVEAGSGNVPESFYTGPNPIKKADGGRTGYKLGKKVVEIVAAGLAKKAGEGKFTKNQILEQMFKNTIKGTKDADTKAKFLNFIEEIKVKPELSKDPNVWNFFTKGMPKNQKLIVYGDDTVDLWTQSEFGPHNIATSAKFQKKHPYLTKDQAVKIQNMEPEDQIFEMKRLETIRKRTANSTGGRVPMWLGGKLPAGKGLVREMLKFMARDSSHGKSPAEMLKMVNPKQIEKFLNDPSLAHKFDKNTGIMAFDTVKDMITKTKTERTDIIEQLLSSARNIKKGDNNLLTYKNQIIEEMVSKGMDRKTAKGFTETLSESLLKGVGPKQGFPKVTEQGLIELENIQKNLLTKDRQLQASGGLAAMLGE